MNKAIGDFSASAYDALRTAYANQLNDPLAEEQEGFDVAGQNYKLETVDARGQYLDSTGLWKYPTGHSDYERPDPDTLITALQAQDSDNDGDIDTLIDGILEEAETDGEEE